jgi:hypothetical protein
MQILPLDEVSETGWTVEEAVKVLMSGGILCPPKIPFDRVHAGAKGQPSLARRGPRGTGCPEARSSGRKPSPCSATRRLPSCRGKAPRLRDNVRRCRKKCLHPIDARSCCGSFR